MSNTIEKKSLNLNGPQFEITKWQNQEFTIHAISKPSMQCITGTLF